jgi:2-polyprenyl-3-methyl-5-hydroxy-6-metoxy-1,4-benzoquinol methylase
VTQPAPSSAELIERWSRNAAAWTDVVRGRRIESGRVATDAAITAAVCRRSPAGVLDLGCGEGWLVGEPARQGVRA